jgi:gamma-glutamyltranspeptidase / glutathione hydrolase
MRGMIVAPQPEAVEAGAEILKRGGNAVDAAIACALVQGVVDPQMTGIAGFGSMQVWLPKRGLHVSLDFHARCPKAARPGMWADLIRGEATDGFGFILEGRVNDLGYQSIAVPGSLRAYEEALAEFGTMDWRDVLQPAIEEARQGFVVRPHVYTMWTQDEARYGRTDYVEKLGFTPSGRALYFRDDGALKRPGDRVVNADLARTLVRIAAGGADLFYQGAIAEEMVADIRAHGGLLSLDDLRDFRTTRAAPLRGTYRGHEVTSCPPPGGGVMVVEMLHILEGFDLAALGHNTPSYLQVLAEAMKRATSDKDRHVGDPAFVEVPTQRLVSKDYAATLADAIRRGERAHVERLGLGESRNTTQVSVIDADGNAVSMTHSLGSPSGVISAGLGFMYNGCMGVFDPRPGRAGSIAPGKARFSSIAPAIVFRDGRPRIVIGAPGGTYIAGSIVQGIVNVVDFGMTMLEAVVAPRVSVTSDAIDVSNRLPRFVTRALEAMGYSVRRSYQSYAFAGLHAIEARDGRLHGAADPQRDGMALEA